MSIRQEIITLLKTDLLKIKTANNYTRTIGSVVHGNLSLDEVNTFDSIQSCFAMGADVTDDKLESSLKVLIPVLIQVFIHVNTDVQKANLVQDEAEIWLENFDWFFYGGKPTIDNANRCALKSIGGVSKFTIIARDPQLGSLENRQSVAVLLRIYVNQLK